MKKLKVKKAMFDKQIVLTQISDIDATLTLTKDTEYPMYGISIVKNKYKNKEKFIKLDMVLLSKKAAQTLVGWYNLGIGVSDTKFDEPLFLRCDCFSELLEIVYDKEEHCFYANIWDNYFLQYNKRVFASSVQFKIEDLKRLVESIVNDKIS